MTQASLDAHAREIDRCNQRGGRMLSLIDLLDGQNIHSIDQVRHRLLCHQNVLNLPQA